MIRFHLSQEEATFTTRTIKISLVLMSRGQLLTPEKNMNQSSNDIALNSLRAWKRPTRTATTIEHSTQKIDSTVGAKFVFLTLGDGARPAESCAPMLEIEVIQISMRERLKVASRTDPHRWFRDSIPLVSHQLQQRNQTFAKTTEQTT